MRAIKILPLVLTFTLTSLVHAEPNLVSRWKFEEGFGSDAYDSSGNENHGIIHGDPCWVSGRIGYYALDFDGDGDYINVDSWFKLETHSTSLWIYPNNLHNGKIIQPIKGTSRSFGYIALTSQGKISHLVRSGTSLDVNKISASTDSVIEPGRWYHIVSIMGLDGNRIYVNGVEQTLSYTAGSASSTESWACIYNSNGPDNLNIGTCIYDSVGHDYFYGKIDDVRIYDRVLSSTEIENLYDRIDLAIAWNAYPPDGQQCTEPNVVLTWSPGDWASDINGHDVYLGSDFNDVNDANTTLTLGVYKGRQDANFYDPFGLERGRIYYWRIDEVNDSNINSPWKGRIWSFENSCPIIELSADFFDFYAVEANGPNPPAQTLSISNSCSGTLNWQITEDCNWLTAEPNSGSSTGELNDVNISIDIAGLAPGVYDCNLTVSEPCACNSPQTITIELMIECYAGIGMPDYDQWVAVGRPECWCYPRQCHCDADGKAQGSPKTGYMYCSTDDLDIMSAGWGKKDPPKGSGILDLYVYDVPVACADFDHQRQGSIKTGYIRIYTDDLDILSLYWQVKEWPKGPAVPADCIPGNRSPEQ